MIGSRRPSPPPATHHHHAVKYKARYQESDRSLHFLSSLFTLWLSSQLTPPLAVYPSSLTSPNWTYTMSEFTEDKDCSSIMQGTEADKAAGAIRFVTLMYNFNKQFIKDWPTIIFLAWALLVNRFRQLFLQLCLPLSPEADGEFSLIMTDLYN